MNFSPFIDYLIILTLCEKLATKNPFHLKRILQESIQSLLQNSVHFHIL